MAKIRQGNAAELEFFVRRIEGGRRDSPRKQLPMLRQLPEIEAQMCKQKRRHRHGKNHDY